jgi:hypothetical protein
MKEGNILKIELRSFDKSMKGKVESIVKYSVLILVKKSESASFHF